jgi:lipopolysaccharide export system protein LptA
MSLIVGGAYGVPSMRMQAQAQNPGAITLRSDVQEANAITGVITARGNVQIDYPARQMTATSAQAEYYSNERRIILSGNVFIVQEGNTLRAETVTYLIDEGQFVALPNPNEQVESVYILPEAEPESVQDEAATGAPAESTVPPRREPPVLLEVSPLDEAPDTEGESIPLGNGD